MKYKNIEMVKGRVAPPQCLFDIATQANGRYTLIEQSAHLILLQFAFTTTIQLTELVDL